jgi:transposase InsO family protein
LLRTIHQIHRKSKGTYGSPRIHAELQAQGHQVGENRVARLMQIDGIRGRVADLYYANPGLDKFYAEIPNRKLGKEITGPDQVWVGDITYLKLGNQWLYLSVVMDLYSRRIIAWALGRNKSSALTLKALDQAIRLRKPAKGLIFHSDRGSEYSAFDYRNRLAARGIIQSMNRPRRMTDNIHMESFFHSMKSDIIHRVQFSSEAEYLKTIRGYMTFYNRVRRHSSLNYLSPANFELQMAA